ncbi:class III lanthionine synthetase LanKC [Streptomyces chartreusis]|uniref:class III lanthionine synthetase LanKC n=1 Tax=Streptomyces chartreusis TaxID=1969 RepID=UPI003D8D6603
MFDALGDAFAHDEYYAPLATLADQGPCFSPTCVPIDWRVAHRDIWAVWEGSRTRRSEQGWKIHVSARLDRAQHILDVVASICFVEQVPFKHVSAQMFFLYLHHKHAPRAQSGKFCVVYPPDDATAGRLLELISDALRGEEGAYVLSDRRYRDSRTVHYRYGAFGMRGRLLPDGTTVPLVRDGSGRDIVDLRMPSFVLPSGITDPFVIDEPVTHQGSVIIRDYEILRVLQHSNAGGAYQARDTRTGRLVFVKEARAHNGFTWDGTSAQERLRHEYEILSALHPAAPGVCPEPLAYFAEWEHDYLVMEHVDGVPLRSWIGHRSPILKAGRSASDFAEYYADCRRVLTSVDAALDRLHGLGYRFGDISPGNIIVTPAGGARLVDFEMVSAVAGTVAVRGGTPGFTPPPEMADDTCDPHLADRYAMAALALLLLAPFHNTPKLTPANLALLRRDLTLVTPVPDDLWSRATVFHHVPAEGLTVLPTPTEVDLAPLRCLKRFADEVAVGLLDMADPANASWVFPPPPMAYRTNAVCVAYGTAGVVHALREAGIPVPEEVEKRLRKDALASRDELAPGYNAGLAGIARVLSSLGRIEEAIALMQIADAHPLARTSVTLADGRAGIGLTWLALHRCTGDVRHLEHAAAAGDAIMQSAEVGPIAGAHDARGLFHGRSGIALFLHHLGRITDNERYLQTGLRLLHEELDRAVALPDGSLSFSDDAVHRRVMPYLSAGSAGVGIALVRYAAAVTDERCTLALPRIVADARKACAIEAGLYSGFAGMVYFLAEHASVTGRDADREDAVRAATGLLKYAIPHARGVRCLGVGSLRFSADLSSGGAGILLTLRHVLHGLDDGLFL